MCSQIDFETFHTPAAMQFSPLLNIQAIIPWLKEKTNKQTNKQNKTKNIKFTNLTPLIL